MATGSLGREYNGGEVIVRQGEVGDCMYVVQDGEVEVVNIADGDIIRLAVLGPGDFFGEMAIFEKEVRSATVRALGKVRLLTIDRRRLLGLSVSKEFLLCWWDDLSSTTSRRPMIGDLTDRPAVVTGAGSGIGAGLAIALARRGATVIATDIATS